MRGEASKDIVTVRSSGDVRMTPGEHSFVTFQATSCVLTALGMRLKFSGDAEAEGDAAYASGWSVTHEALGWSQPFVDGATLSAFPRRDWPKLRARLQAIPTELRFAQGDGGAWQRLLPAAAGGGRVGDGGEGGVAAQTKSRICRDWRQGSCSRGGLCTFAHGEATCYT